MTKKHETGSVGGKRRTKPRLAYTCAYCNNETDELDEWFDENGVLACPMCGNHTILKNSR